MTNITTIRGMQLKVETYQGSVYITGNGQPRFAVDQTQYGCKSRFGLEGFGHVEIHLDPENKAITDALFAELAESREILDAEEDAYEARRDRILRAMHSDAEYV